MAYQKDLKEDQKKIVNKEINKTHYSFHFRRVLFDSIIL